MKELHIINPYTKEVEVIQVADVRAAKVIVGCRVIDWAIKYSENHSVSAHITTKGDLQMFFDREWIAKTIDRI